MAIANRGNDMDKNEVMKILETAKDKNGEVPMRLVRQAFEKLPEPCEDTISRRAAIAVADFTDYRGLTVEDVKKVTDEVVKGLKQLPPVQPENVPSRKGVFIPDITVEMFRNASLEGIEDLLASGEMEDISLPSAQPELANNSPKLANDSGGKNPMEAVKISIMPSGEIYG